MIAKNLIWISLVAFVLALAAQPAFSATLFVDAAAPPGGNGSSPAHAFTSLVDAVAAARVLPRQGALVIHLTAGTYLLPASKRGDGLLIDVPGLRLEEEIFSLDIPSHRTQGGGPDKISIPKRRLATRSLQARPMIAAGLRSKLPKGQV